MKNKNNLLFILIFFSLQIQAQEVKWQGPSIDFSKGKLEVSDNGRFIQFEDGSPFFYLGDTGWELFHRLDKKDAERYLENRREKGFTVIQAVILAELDGLNTPNAEGETPLIDNDPTKPNEKYFKHVDWVINKAAEKGIYIGLLPTWGDKVDKQWGKGPVIFNPDNAYKYGAWLGKRYKDYPNIIWINGGDRDGGGKNYPVWEAMGKGINSADNNHLITFHPWGEHSSSEWFHHSDWLDFNMMQTGHSQRSYAIFKRLLKSDYELHPVKPTFDGEPRYEDHPVGWKPEILGWFDDADVRQAIYWNLFTGGFGHTYGAHPIWQMKTADKDPIGLVRNNWYDVLDLKGAWDLIHARILMESRPFFSRYPDQSIIMNSYFPEPDQVVTTRGDGYAFIYVPTGWGPLLDLQKLGYQNLNVWWYNPRTGEIKNDGKIEGKGFKEFKTPTRGRGEDWVLVLDDASRNFTAPGR
jgi:hypothetical protein